MFIGIFYGRTNKQTNKQTEKKRTKIFVFVHGIETLEVDFSGSLECVRNVLILYALNLVELGTIRLSGRLIMTSALESGPLRTCWDSLMNTRDNFRDHFTNLIGYFDRRSL